MSWEMDCKHYDDDTQDELYKLRNKVDKLEEENKKLRNCIEKAYEETLSQTYEYTEYGRMLDAIITLEKCLKELED